MPASCRHHAVHAQLAPKPSTGATAAGRCTCHSYQQTALMLFASLEVQDFGCLCVPTNFGCLCVPTCLMASGSATMTTAGLSGTRNSKNGPYCWRHFSRSPSNWPPDSRCAPMGRAWPRPSTSGGLGGCICMYVQVRETEKGQRVHEQQCPLSQAASLQGVAPSWGNMLY